MRLYIPLLLSAGSLFTTVMARNFTVINNCPFTIWPAIFTGINVRIAAPNQPTGWAAPAYSSVSFFVPDNWTAGRIWGRRHCDFSIITGPNSCLDGGCNGGLPCDLNTGTGVPPATVAEFTLSDVPEIADYYDISLVDGFNLPMRIDNNQGCGVPLCDVDLGLNCPTPLQGPFDSIGYSIGCQSACEAGLASDLNNSPNCCTGFYSNAATCLPSTVQYYSYFKTYCPNTFVYAYDDIHESSGTALFSCPSVSEPDYTITFCPSG